MKNWFIKKFETSSFHFEQKQTTIIIYLCQKRGTFDMIKFNLSYFK